MGYRSDVAYAIAFPSEDKRIRFMATAALDPEIELKDFKLIDDTTVLLSYDDVKWYDEYDWVKAHKRLLEDAKNQLFGWQFLRVGEEAGDVEQDGDDGDCCFAPELIEISQSLYITDEGEAYPVGESLTKEDN
jgi:hypothetical protein